MVGRRRNLIDPGKRPVRRARYDGLGRAYAKAVVKDGSDCAANLRHSATSVPEVLLLLPVCSPIMADRVAAPLGRHRCGGHRPAISGRTGAVEPRRQPLQGCQVGECAGDCGGEAGYLQPAVGVLRVDALPLDTPSGGATWALVCPAATWRSCSH